MPQIVEPKVLPWAPKTSGVSSPEPEETRETPWRVATTLVIVATLVMIPIVYLILPSGSAAARGGRGYTAFVDQRIDDESEEAPVVVVDGVARPISDQNNTNGESSLTEENEPASLPDPREFFGDLIKSVWAQSGSEPTGVRVGSTAAKMHRDLLSTFSELPSEIEVLYMPPMGKTGLFTLKVRDSQGREGVVGVRLVRLKGGETPWEVESFVVVQPPQ